MQRITHRAGIAILAASLVQAIPWSASTPAAAQEPLPTHRLFSVEWRPLGGDLAGSGVAVGPRGDIYVLDAARHRVVQLDAARRFVRAWGAPGPREGEFDLRTLDYPSRVDDGHRPLGIAVAPDGRMVVVADHANHRLQRFTAEGRFLGASGHYGVRPGNMRGPSGVAVAPDGTIFVADTFNQRVQRFGANGEWLDAWPIDAACGMPEPILLGLAVAADGTVFVGDGQPQQPCIMALDGTGRRLHEWRVTAHGAPEKPAVSIRGLAIAPGGDLVALEWHAKAMVARYRPDGKLISRWVREPAVNIAPNGGYYAGSDIAVAPDGTIVSGGVVYSPDGRAIGGATAPDFGEYGQLAQAEGMAVDGDGTVYVADPPNGRVQVFDAGGRFRTLIDRTGSGEGRGGVDSGSPLAFPIDVAIGPTGTVHVLDAGRDRVEVFGRDGAWLRGWGGPGRGPGELRDPEGIAVGADGVVYVADSGNHRIQRFATTGVFLGEWGRRGAGPGDLDTPRGIAVAPDGTVRVVDSGNRRVQVFSPDGAALYGLGESGAGDGQFVDPVDVAVDAAGATYVTDPGNHRLHRFDACGQVRQSWGGVDGNSATAGRMIAPKGVAVAPDGAVYVGDSALHRVQRFTAEGSMVGVFGWTKPEAPPAYTTGRRGEWSSEGIVPDNGMNVAMPDGTLLVISTFGGEVQRFGPDGACLGRWSLMVRTEGWLRYLINVMAGPGGTVHVIGVREDGPGLEPDPLWLHRYTSDGVFLGGGRLQGMRGETFGAGVAPDGTVLVGSTDTQGRRVYRFGPDGRMLTGWKTTWPAPPPSGSNTGPYGLVVGADGTAFVPYCCDWQVKRYAADGTPLATWGGKGSGPGAFGGACDDCDIRPLAAAPDGTVYIGDQGNQRIQRFGADGAFLGAIGSDGPPDEMPRHYYYLYPRRIAAGADRRLYVLDRYGKRIDAYAPQPPPTWHAAYFRNRWLAQRPMAVAAPAEIAFDWGDVAPAPYIPADGFSARFERSMVLPAGVHDLVVAARGGVRVWVDARLLVDDWDGPEVDAVVGFTSPGGAHHVTVEYNDPGGAAGLGVEVR